MSSRSGVLIGSQRPRVACAPVGAMGSAGGEAVELAASAGLLLDDWQAHVLDVALGERADGSWSAFEVGLVVPRQNGKGAVLEARELAGLFLFGEELILHSAHEFKTAQEAFRRVLGLVENSDHLRKRVKRVRTSHGEEGIELLSGARLRFVARSTGSGRGFSGDCVILDEAYNLPAEAVAALLPTLSARPNPQLWYTSSAGMATSTQLRGVRERGLAKESPRLAYFEWSAAETARRDDPEAWAEANPALGLRISAEFIEQELQAMSAAPGEFARERLGVWDTDAVLAVIPLHVWAAAEDQRSKMVGGRCFAIDVSPDRSSSAIAVAGRRKDGRPHVEVVDRLALRNVVDRVLELEERWQPDRWVLDAASPSGSLIPELQARGIEPVVVGTRQLAQACGLFYDMAMALDDQERPAPELRHIGQASLTAAIGGARKRPVGDAWAWARKDSTVDLSPLVAATLALWAAVQPQDEGAAPLLAFIAGSD